MSTGKVNKITNILKTEDITITGEIDEYHATEQHDVAYKNIRIIIKNKIYSLEGCHACEAIFFKEVKTNEQ